MPEPQEQRDRIIFGPHYPMHNISDRRHGSTGQSGEQKKDDRSLGWRRRNVCHDPPGTELVVSGPRAVLSTAVAINKDGTAFSTPSPCSEGTGTQRENLLGSARSAPPRIEIQHSAGNI
jgi:hypothetical protein